MGSIRERTNAKGEKSFQALVAIQRDGKTFRDSATFERRPLAAKWMKEREAELKAPGAILAKPIKGPAPTLGDAVDAYVKDGEANMGRTKRNTLATIRKDEICDIECEKVTSIEIREFMDRRAAIGNSPATVQNYVAHLSGLFKVAEGAFGFPLDYDAILKAQRVGRKLGKVASSKQRDRLPTMDELDRILTHFEERVQREDTSLPLVKIVVFALFSTRRSDEIVRIRWDDLERAEKDHPPRVMVRDMKNPGKKKGNDTWCLLPEPAMRIVDSMDQTDARIFPFNGKTVGAYWTDACQLLGIEDLHFHDLRHAGITRLAEMGQSEMEMRAVSGHRGPTSLLRYSHYRRTGDRFDDWPWIGRAIRGHA